MKQMLSAKEYEFFETEAKKIVAHEKYKLLHGFIQHHNITTFEHAVSVAFLAYKEAILKRRKVDLVSLIRGALLHDFYLYDWHDKNRTWRWHGFKHAKIALEKAREYFDVNPIEEDIILYHMWPLNVFLPKTIEGRLVTFADKRCSLSESLKSRKRIYEFIDRLK